jgi:hypothetical protein
MMEKFARLALTIARIAAPKGRENMFANKELVFSTGGLT